MNLISANNISRSESGRLLFDNLTFGIDEHSRTAIVGRNGCGKTTLMKLIAGLKSPEDGNIARNRELKTSFLEQSPSYNPGDRVADFVLAGDSEEIRIIREYELITADMENDSAVERMSELTAEMDRLDCWNLENRIHSLLSELGINELDAGMETLSGGMLKKTALARTLVIDANLLILDEPTNHLDIETINWLEQYLKKSTKAILLVTHDRYFMDSVCERILEIEDNNLYSYEGNYSSYLTQKSLRQTVKDKENDRVNNFLRNEAEWIHRGPRARAGKDKKRKERFFEVKDGRPAAKAVSDSFSVEGKRLGGKIMDLESLEKRYGDQLLITDFSFSFKKGDKLGIVGPNGSGKTTLLNIITGRIEPDKGSVDTGVNTKIGYYDQMSKELPGTMKAVDYINETAEILRLKDGNTVTPAQFLERFLFPKELLYTEIENLSGGEKKKLYLLKLLLENPNFLVFDEPTNDFDIQTLSILENFLENFSGCTVIVSHDRFFLDRTVEFLLVLDGKGNVRGFSGAASDFYSNNQKLYSSIEDPSTPSENSSRGKKQVNRAKKGLSFKEKKELESIEEEIMLLEEEKEALDRYFSSPDAASADLSVKKNRYDDVILEIEERYSRWEYLESNK